MYIFYSLLRYVAYDPCNLKKQKLSLSFFLWTHNEKLTGLIVEWETSCHVVWLAKVKPVDDKIFTSLWHKY